MQLQTAMICILVVCSRCSAICFQSFVFSMVVSISQSFQIFSVLLICLPGCSHQEVIKAAAGNQSINHGCPSWFIPINNSSDRCKCGEPIHRPGRVVLCDPNTNQTLVRVSYCMDYNEDDDEVFVGDCPYINKKGEVQGMYVKFPQNVSELNPFLCSGLNRTGVMCSQCQEGLGTAIFSYSMQCLPCMSSGLGWTLYVFLATFPTTILFLVVLIFQCRCITSGPMNAYIFVSQFAVSTLNNQPSIVNLLTSASFSILKVFFTISGIWNLDFFRYLIPPFCVSDQISPLHVVALEYVVAFYPLLLTVIVYICIQLHARDCQVIVCLCRVFCKCFSSCRQRWGRQWNPFASLVHTFAAFLLLSYSKILIISLRLLSYTQLHLPTGEVLDPPRRVLHDPSLEWFGEKHLPFALPAIFILCIFVFLPALFLLLYPMKIFQKCLGCCGRRLLALHAFADVFQGCYKNGTNGTRDCRYFAGLYLVFRIVLLPALYGGSIFGFYDEMVSVVCLVTASLLFLLFRPYKDNSWLNIWDSTLSSLSAFVIYCVMYSKYVASVPYEILEVIAALNLVYLVIYVVYTLLAWMKTLQICKKKYKDRLISETEEPDRLTHPEDYENDKEVKLLLSDDGNDDPQHSKLETYPVCGNSQQKYGSI